MAKKTKKKKSPENRGTSRGRENLALGAKFRWQPGQSGNPGGRPKFALLSKAYREILASPMPGYPDRTYAEGIAETLTNMALAGSVAAAQELGDRSEGRPKVSVDFRDSPDPLRELVKAMDRESARIGKPEGLKSDDDEALIQ